MKTSEQIRAAIDEDLASSYEDCSNKGITLFGALSWNHMPSAKASNILLTYGHDAVYWQDRESFHQAQCVRFMYGDFLAHMFESEGD